MTKTCMTCGIRLGPRNRRGYCRRHTSAALMADPEIRARQKAGVIRSIADPERIKRMRETMAKNVKAPGAREKRVEAAKRIRLWEHGHAALNGNTDAYARAGRKRTATVLSHIPRECRDDYRHLVRSKRFTAREAERIVLADHEEKMARFRREIGAETL